MAFRLALISRLLHGDGRHHRGPRCLGTRGRRRSSAGVLERLVLGRLPGVLPAPASIPIGGARSSRASCQRLRRGASRLAPSSSAGRPPCAAARRSRSPTRTARRRYSVAAVTAPVLVIAGENDPTMPAGRHPAVGRCVRARGRGRRPSAVSGGPSREDAVDERVHHMELILDFFARSPDRCPERSPRRRSLRRGRSGSR